MPGTGDDGSVDCAFCEIIARNVAASIIYEDASTLAFLDLRQPNYEHGGHVLIVPRLHIESIEEIDRDTGAHLMDATVKVARAMRATSAPDGLSIWQSNSEAGGQEVPHVHFHVLARMIGDGLLHAGTDRASSRDGAAREALASRLRAGLA